jgi:hypothetical protein
VTLYPFQHRPEVEISGFCGIVQPRPVYAATRVSLAHLLARLFDWRSALVVVQPTTMIRWHRAGWRLKCQPGRPPIPGAGIKLHSLFSPETSDHVERIRAFFSGLTLLREEDIPVHETRSDAARMRVRCHGDRR